MTEIDFLFLGLGYIAGFATPIVLFVLAYIFWGDTW